MADEVRRRRRVDKPANRDGIEVSGPDPGEDERANGAEHPYGLPRHEAGMAENEEEGK